MKVTQAINFKSLVKLRSLAMLMMVAMLAVSALAQKSRLKTTLEPSAPLAISVDIDQCANGPLASPIPCNTSTGNSGYVRGNMNESKSHYFEGNSLPIRIVAGGLNVGQIYSVTIGYDYTKGGQYATDYLTNYNRTESVNNDPCVGVTGCDNFNTYPIPLDPEVALGFNGVDDAPGGPTGGDDIQQIAGVFTLFGASIDPALIPGTGVSGYTLSGLTTGDSTKSIIVTFRADETNVVIAYGAHISTRTDWGITHSAINISGSPYHNFIVDFPGANSGNRDLQLSASAVIFPASVTIIKKVLNLVVNPACIGDGQTTDTCTSTFVFPFTSTTNFDADGNFNLVDNNANPGGGGSLSKTDVILFGSTNAINVTETNFNQLGRRYTLSALSCTELAGGVPAVINTTWDFNTGSVHVVPDEGEMITCTFTNSENRPTAALVAVSGRVTTPDGRGLRGATVTMTDSLGNLRTTTTSSFGTYTFVDVQAGDVYVMGVNSKLYRFATQLVQVNDTLTGIDFMGQE